MITNKERAKLRGLAVNVKSTFSIGKEGLTKESLIQINNYLNANELIKISISRNIDLNVKETAIEIANELGAIVVETKGFTIVLYKVSSNEKVKHILDGKI